MITSASDIPLDKLLSSVAISCGFLTILWSSMCTFSCFEFKLPNETWLLSLIYKACC